MSPPAPGRPRRVLLAAAALPLMILAVIAVTGRNRSSKPLAQPPPDPGGIFTVLTGPGTLMHPRDVDFAPDGSMVVVDRTATVHRLSATGALISSVPMPERGRGNPQGVSFTSDGRVLVADTHYNRVVILSGSGSFLFAFGSFGEAPGQFIYPTAAVESADGRFFVAEYGGNDRIQVFDREGRHLSTFSGPGQAEGLLSRPAGMCFCDDGLLYVADSCNHRIQVFDSKGAFVRAFGSLGPEPGSFQYPFDVAPFWGSKLAVVEYGNNRVQVLDRFGASVAVAGGPGSFIGGFFNPWGIASDGHDLVVADTWNHRLVRVSLGPRASVYCDPAPGRRDSGLVEAAAR